MPKPKQDEGRENYGSDYRYIILIMRTKVVKTISIIANIYCDEVLLNIYIVFY